MPIPDTILGRWGHHHSGMASKQAHVSIRDALASYTGWPKGTKYDVFLQGSYKNDTNLRKDSDVDIVVQLEARLKPSVAALSEAHLEQSEAHQVACKSWRLFRRQVLKALRARYKDDVTPGRKSLKLAKGQIPASADIVVTLRYETGLAFYLPDEHRWVVSYPQQHYENGSKKERTTRSRYKRTLRMFKVARNELVEGRMIGAKTAPSYFIECLLYNVPDRLYGQNVGQTYCDILNWLSAADLREFKCQNGVHELFGQTSERWTVDKARAFLGALMHLWEEWR